MVPMSARLWSLLSLAALFFPAASHAQPTVRDPNFSVQTVHSGNGTISLDFGPNGRLYVTEKRGRVLTFTLNASGNYNAPTVFADIISQVTSTQESGLLGMVLDPDFANNRFMYLFYTTGSDQRLTRITASQDYATMVGGSEVVLLQGLPRSVTFHKAGDIKFHPNDPNNIYITLGDDNSPTFVQDPNRYEGKILRVNKANGQGLAANPFYDGNANSTRSRVWAVGFRNPFRFTFHPNTPLADVLYTSENGNGTDRMSLVRMGSNGSWNQTGDNGGFLNPPDTNHRVLATFSSPTSALGIAIARGGPFADPANPGSDVMYVGNWLRPSGGGIWRWRLSGANADTATPIAADAGQAFVRNINAMSLRFGPDGALYTTWSNNDASLGGFYTVLRIRYTAGTPPVSNFTANPTRGAAPLNVTFTDRSTDSDGQIQSWSWNFGDGGMSSAQNPTHTYTNPGTYNVDLRVTDDDGLSHTSRVTITVVRALSLTLNGRIFDGRNAASPAINSPIQLRLYGPDGTTPIGFTGGVGPQQNGIDIPAGGNINNTIQVEVTTPSLVVSAGEGSALRPQRHGFNVPAGANSFTATLNYHLSDTAVSGVVSDTRMMRASVDIGVARVSEGMPYALAGGRDYLQNSGLPPSGVNHRIVSDELGYYYVPIRPGDGGVTFYFDAVADTGRMTYVPTVFSANVAQGQQLIRDIQLGLQMGGAGCDDLSARPDVPAVDYASQIQPIWNGACTGCHNSGSGNSGGLDLQMDSYQHLVGVDSREIMGRKIVEPGAPDRSFLFEKINCNNPQVGTRMRPADPMPIDQQVLIRSWIAQGARLTPVVDMDGGLTDGAGMDAVVNPDGQPNADATPGLDAAIGADASTSAADASTMRRDASSGPPARGETRGGCGCSTTHERSGALGALLLLGLLLAGRQRRS